MSIIAVVKITFIVLLTMLTVGTTLLVMACGKLEKKLGLHSDDAQLKWIREYRKEQQK